MNERMWKAKKAYKLNIALSSYIQIYIIIRSSFAKQIMLTKNTLVGSLL